MDAHISGQHPPVSAATAHFGAGNLGLNALVPAVLCTFFATTVVILRWYTRCKIVHCIGLDDCVILLSLLLSWAMCLVIVVSVNEGLGTYDDATDTIKITKLILANNIIWTVLVNVTKASILMQYLRIFSGRIIRRLCYTLAFLLIPAACWGTFGGIFLCEPVAKLWQPKLPGQCQNAHTYWCSVAAVDIFLDFAVLILPIPSIAGLHLPRKQKIATTLVFIMGFLVCFVSVTRLLTVVVTSQQGDFVMSGIWSVIWSAVEGNVGIICACLLSLKALVTKLFPRLIVDDDLSQGQMRIAILPASSEREVSGPATWSHSMRSSMTVGSGRAGLSRPPASCMPPSQMPNRTRHKPADSREEKAHGHYASLEP
ncbi:hypothetical protein CERZMDRAFT_49170 [Cercospora zeae-maydis SCOH1-5]|uniref:Rhodopsin domain-containing protein n=1 Tax=Cercospora zeae-maydis SCOH1-5 TaxID=717836 RepID=A0A6A6F5R3_9PEZI|nr:hypothetical protein CERZMDRAFT_49170 [Cercospora zeae-maydis SCOH1-5]